MQLQMSSAGPRGRSGAGASIEGMGGAKVVVASAMPLQGVRTQQRSISADTDEYGDSGTPRIRRFVVVGTPQPA